MPFLSKTEKKVLAAWKGENPSHKVIAERVDKSTSAVNSHLTRIFKKHREAIQTMNEHPQIFKGRFKRHYSETRNELNKLRKNMKNIKRD